MNVRITTHHSAGVAWAWERSGGRRGCAGWRGRRGWSLCWGRCLSGSRRCGKHRRKNRHCHGDCDKPSHSGGWQSASRCRRHLHIPASPTEIQRFACPSHATPALREISIHGREDDTLPQNCEHFGGNDDSKLPAFAILAHATTVEVRIQASSYRLKTATAFCPPNPKPLTIAASTLILRATFGT